MILEPRLDPDEIDYLQGFLSCQAPGTKMVEWGSGGSTLMFLNYFNDGQFISIEHNREWYDKVNRAIESGDYSAKALANFSYCWRPPTYMGKPVDLRFYGYGIPFEENPCFAANYINPESSGVQVFDADIFFVDGICRGAVLATIKAKHQKRWDATRDKWISPVVFIHDYYGPENREGWYDWASSLFGGVSKVGNTLARIDL